MERFKETPENINITVAVNISENTTVFRELGRGRNEIMHKIDIGYQNIAVKCFHQFPPTIDEIDNAINIVEEAVTPLDSYFKESASLYSADEQMRLVLALAYNVQRDSKGYEILPRIELENLFTRLSHIIYGLPASQDEIPENVEFAAFLLILREILHHLDFKEVKYIIKRSE